MARAENDNPSWLTTSDVAAIFDVTTETVRRWTGEGLLSTTRVGKGFYLYALEDVERFQRMRASK